MSYAAGGCKVQYIKDKWVASHPKYPGVHGSADSPVDALPAFSNALAHHMRDEEVNRIRQCVKKNP